MQGIAQALMEMLQQGGGSSGMGSPGLGGGGGPGGLLPPPISNQVTNGYQPYQSTFGKTSPVPQSKGDVAADTVGNVLNAWMGYRASQKAEEDRSAEGIMTLLKLGYPPEVAFKNKKGIRALEKRLGIELPKGDEGVMAPEKSFGKIMEEFAKTQFGQAQTPDEKFAIGERFAQTQPTYSEKVGVEARAKMDEIDARYKAEAAVQRQKQTLEISSDLTKHFDNPVTGYDIAKALASDDRDALTKVNIPLGKEQQNISIQYQKMLGEVYKYLKADPRDIKAVADIMTKGGVPDISKLGPAYAPIFAALDMNIKKLQMAETGVDITSKNQGIAKNNLELTKMIDVNGTPLPLAIAKDVLTAQEINKKLKIDPNIAEKMRAYNAMMSQGDAKSAGALQQDIMKSLGFTPENPDYNSGWGLLSYWFPKLAGPQFQKTNPVLDQLVPQK